MFRGIFIRGITIRIPGGITPIQFPGLSPRSIPRGYHPVRFPGVITPSDSRGYHPALQTRRLLTEPIDGL